MQRRKDCRNYYKELRNTMFQEEVQEKSALVCQHILESDAYRKADCILGYYPFGNEVDCLRILEQAFIDGKQVALPRTQKDSTMNFFVVRNLLEDMEKGAFSIMEPKASCELFEATKNDSVIALVPGVVFDNKGNRYGYGRGYYDRYFARFPYIKRVALAFKLQIANEDLETLTTDVKMHTLVTEDKFIKME